MFSSITDFFALYLSLNHLSFISILSFQRTFGQLMQDTAQEVVSSKSSSSNADKLARTLGSTRFQAAARRDSSEDASRPPVGLFGGGNGAVLKLLQRGKKGKDAVRSIVVPETANIAQRSVGDSEADKQRALEKAQNKAFILDYQEKELSGEMPPNGFGSRALHAPLPKHLLPGQSAADAGPGGNRESGGARGGGGGGLSVDARMRQIAQQQTLGLRVNSRAAGLSEAVREASSWSQPKFARRGFGRGGSGAHK